MTYYDGDYEITVTTGHARGVGRDMSGYCKHLYDASEGLVFIVNKVIPAIAGVLAGLAVLNMIF